MESAVLMTQCGNGGAATKAGNHASGKKAGGGAASVDQEPMGEQVTEQRVGVGHSNDGNLLVFSATTNNNTGLVDTGEAKPDASMVAAFKRGELNATPVFVRSTGIDRETLNENYKAVDPVSARIMASAKAAGSRVNTIQVPASGKHDEIVRKLQKANGKPVFSRVEQRKAGGRGNSLDAGGLIAISPSEVKGGKVTASQRQIDSAARAVRSSGGRAWTPIAVKQSNDGTYSAVGGQANALAIARRANSKVYAYVVGGE